MLDVDENFSKKKLQTRKQNKLVTRAWYKAQKFNYLKKTMNIRVTSFNLSLFYCILFGAKSDLSFNSHSVKLIIFRSNEKV